MSLELLPVVSAPFQENTWLLWETGRPEVIVVDPGLEPRKILDALQQRQLVPIAFLLTHGHADHIGGNRALKQQYPDVPLIIGRNEAHLLTDPVANLSGLAGVPVTSPPADQLVDDGEQLQVGPWTFLVREIPGHSPGHVVYVLQGDTPTVVLGGDVLFQGSIGRTDFPGGSLQTLLTGIREKLFCLPDETVVYPGHGPTTTLGEERRWNPYCGERAGLFNLSDTAD